MFKNNQSTFYPEDVTLLLTDITGKIEPLPTAQREALIQGGIHYSEMLPLEYKPSEQYSAEYYRSLEAFSVKTAQCVIVLAEKIYIAKNKRAVIVSLARAGTPIGILIKKIQCQLNASTNQPPSSGPITDDKEKTPANTP